MKKISSDKYKKSTEFLVESDNNLGINKIPITLPIFSPILTHLAHLTTFLFQFEGTRRYQFAKV